jgi:hypothetical protein
VAEQGCCRSFKSTKFGNEMMAISPAFWQRKLLLGLRVARKKTSKKTTKNFADSKLVCNFATFFAPPEKRRPGDRTLKELQ